MRKKDYLPLNWVDGLKLTSRHFIENQHSQTEALNNEAARNIASYNYGLGDYFDSTASNLEIEISGDTVLTVSVKLKSCNAITQGGIPIFYYDGLYGDYVPCATIPESSAQSESSVYAVIVSVDPYQQIPVGEPDPDEIPLHHPYVLPSIGLHLIPKSQVNKPFFTKNFLQIAEVCKQGNTYTLNRNYIPPVQRSAYHTDVKAFILQLSQTLDNIRNNIILIYSRNISERRRGILTDNTLLLCKAFFSFYDHQIFFIKQLAPELPPIYLVQAMNELANSISSTLQSISEAEKEELLQYYYEWTDIIPSDFIKGIEDVTALVYSHTDISHSLQVTSIFISLLSRMFKKMCELEYIGMARENIVVSDESIVDNPPIEKKRWSFM